MAEKPKRPLSAYFIWLHTARPLIQQANPHLKGKEIVTMAGAAWKKLSDKSEWEAKAAVAKQKYALAVEEFKRNGGDMKAATVKKRKNAGSKEAPTKATKKEAPKSKETVEEYSDSD